MDNRNGGNNRRRTTEIEKGITEGEIIERIIEVKEIAASETTEEGGGRTTVVADGKITGVAKNSRRNKSNNCRNVNMVEEYLENINLFF